MNEHAGFASPVPRGEAPEILDPPAAPVRPGTAPAATRPDALPLPAAVARDPVLAEAGKRAILASWLSDARAVTDAPGLRRLDGGELVAVDDILAALAALDGRAETPAAPVRPFARRARPRPRWAGGILLRRRRRDDDDDPPPCPATIAVPVRPNRLPDALPRAAATASASLAA